MGKSFTTSSCQIPQAGNGARVDGCSGAMKVAYPSFFNRMNKTFIITFVSLLIKFSGYSQTIYGAIAPDSIHKKCRSVIISEIGEKAFNDYVRFIKSDAHTKDSILKSYTLFYSFGFPNINESHVVFSLNYKVDGNKSGVIKDVAFKNHTRLPGSIKSKGVKVISYTEAKKTALAADTTLKKFQDKLYAEISTDYSASKKDYFFVWYFYYLEPCKNCEAEAFNAHSVYIDATTGKVLASTKK